MVRRVVRRVLQRKKRVLRRLAAGLVFAGLRSEGERRRKKAVTTVAGHAKRKAAEAAAAKENRKDDKASAAGDAKSVEKAAKAPTKKAAATPRKRKPVVKDYSKTKEFKTVREALVTKACAELGALDPLQLDRIDEIMDLWCQRQLLRDDVRKRGPTVLDERGRESENRCISLGLQVSKQILELYKALGLVTEPTKAAQGKSVADDDEEDDDL